MSSEENTVIPECFKQFETFPGAIFENGKLYFPHYSTFLLVLETFIGLILSFAFIYLLIITGLYRYKYLFFFLVSFFIFLLVYCSIRTGIYTAIDYQENLLYKEFSFFGKTLFTFGYVEIKDILQVSNNVIPQCINPEGKNNRVKPNPKTNLFHKYVVSFLVNNGDIVDFLELGGYEGYFEVSKNLAKAISEYWGIPLMVCGDSQRIYVTGQEERYHLALEGIPFSYARSVIITIIIIVTLVVFGISNFK